MYTAPMAHVTIYLTPELREQVKHAKLPVSEVCQLALKRELARRRRRTSHAAGRSRPTTKHQEGTA